MTTIEDSPRTSAKGKPKTDVFDQAMGEFALACADQTARDHAALVAAERAGRIKALVEEDL